jgi:hypothetical protein
MLLDGLSTDVVPGVVGDNPHGHRGFAFEVGCMRGMAQAAGILSASHRQGGNG